MATYDIFTMPDDQELTNDVLLRFIRKNDTKTNKRYSKLWKAYNNDYLIFHAPRKEYGKPDNRIAVNKARYLVDTFEGFFMGIPIKISSDDENVDEYIKSIEDGYNGEDLNAELSSIVSIFGRGYRIAFVNENGEIGSAYLDPMESFAIYNNSIDPRMLYFVRTYMDANKIRRGSVADDSYVRYFHIEGGDIVWDEEQYHGFSGVPCTEFILNPARRGLFEDGMSAIDAFNKALSEKANDCDYYGDAYLKIIGPKIDSEDAVFLRDTRIINLITKGTNNGTTPDADFMAKPSDDATQEHLLDRLDKEIFITSMSCQYDEQSFGTSSGVALRFKMQAMAALSARKWRKFSASLKDFYKLVCSNPVTPLKEDDWKTINLIHTDNYTTNLSEEAETASKLSGIVSRETQLSTLSIVDDVSAELEKIRQEEMDEDYETDYETKRTENETDEETEKGENENDDT